MFALILPELFKASMAPVGELMDKPSLDEVLKYAKPLVLKFISQMAADLPQEQKEEIQQTLYVRLIEAYAKLDPEQGWKSFVFNHCRGAVLDYMKFGKGFQESKWSLQKKEGEGSKYNHKINKRISIYGENDDSEQDVDLILGQNGIFASSPEEEITIRWELVAKMASKDEGLHAFAKLIRGMSIEEMAPVFGNCRTRVGQIIQNFIARFDDPKEADTPYFKQVCYALGICKKLGMDDADQSFYVGFSMGHNLVPVDLDSKEVCHHLREQASQMGLFDDEKQYN